MLTYKRQPLQSVSNGNTDTVSPTQLKSDNHGLYEVKDDKKEFNSLKETEQEIIDDRPKTKIVREFFQELIDQVEQEIQDYDEEHE